MTQFTQSDKDTLTSLYDYLNDDLSSLNNERKLIKNKLTHYLNEKKKQILISIKKKLIQSLISIMKNLL